MTRDFSAVTLNFSTTSYDWRVIKPESDICNHGQIETSIAAYDSIKGRTALMRQQIVDRLISLPGGATCEELEVLLNMKHQTASARLSELLRDGIVVRTDEKRKTTGGRLAWVLAVSGEKRI